MSSTERQASMGSGGAAPRSGATERAPASQAWRGAVLKASAVTMRGTDLHAMPVDQLAAEAHRAGHVLGYEEGYRAGAVDAGQRLAEGAEALAAAVRTGVARLDTAASSRREADAAQLVELALAVAEWAVRRELSSVPAAFFGCLEEMLAGRGRAARVEIATSPAFAEPTRSWVTDPNVAVVAAADLEDGEARVVVEDTTVFSTFTDAFTRARELLESLASAPDLGAAPPDPIHAWLAGARSAAALDDSEDTVELLYDVREAGRGTAEL